MALASLRKRLVRRLDVGAGESLCAVGAGAGALAAECAALVEAERTRAAQLAAQETAAQTALARLDADQTFEKVRRCLAIVTEIGVLELAQRLTALQSYPSLASVPPLVVECIGILRSMNNASLQNTRIYEFCVEVAEGVRGRVLGEFLLFFERHLDAGGGEAEAGDWVGFVAASRDWLLAYVLVSLLPLAMTQGSGSAVLARFCESADEALLPLWGRFQFHLEHARESQSRDQILWTFQYALYFSRLLVDMCGGVLLDGSLAAVCDCDYRSAMAAHVVGKVTRFMRAHVAAVLVRCDEQSFGSTVLALAENALLYDHRAAELSDTREARLCGVLLDSPATSALWLQRDAAYFKAALLRACDANAYSPSFSEQDARGPLRCYRCLYASMRLYASATQRYRYADPAGRARLSGAVLEPLLLAAMALLLFRVRAHPLLRSVTEERRSDDMHPTARGLPPELEELVDSVDYYRRCLLGLAAEAHSSGRLGARWRPLLPWVKSAAYSNLTPAHCVERVFDGAEEPTVTSAGEAGGSSDVEVVVATVGAMSAELQRQCRALLASATYRD